MLEQVLHNLNNWFVADIREGEFTVQSGSITLPFLQNGQYYRICGSVFNDGLHKYGEHDLKAETFRGTVWALAVPAGVIALADEIEAWESKNGEAAASPFQSESFGGYSYSKKSDANGANGASWQSAFASRLNAWRKI